MRDGSVEESGWGSHPGRPHQVLTAQVARRIVDRIATSLEKRVSLTDRSGRIVASSDSGLVGTIPRVATWALGSGQAAQAEGENLGISEPLQFGDTLVGAVVIHDPSRHAREVIGVVKSLAELLAHQICIVEETGQQEQLRGQLISDVLYGRIETENGQPPREAAIFGIDLALPRVVVAIGVADDVARRTTPATGESSLPIEARADRLRRGRADLIRRALDVAGPLDTDAWGIVDDRWLALLVVVDPAQAGRERARVARRIERVIDAMSRASGVAVWAGIGRHYDGWQSLSQSFADATCAADGGMRLFGPNRAYSLEDLGIAALLTNASASAKQELASTMLRPLEGQPDLLATVDTFLRNDLSPRATTRALTIHRHTLAYRLEKVRHLTGLDPRKFRDAAQISAALMLRRLSALATPDGSRGAS